VAAIPNTKSPLRGVVFLSHASPDKEIVERVLAALEPTANVFYDVQTIAAGQSTVEAMKSGVDQAAVFVLFHSPASETVWVQYEQDLAEIAKIRHRDLQILACPINNSTHHTLPEWMKSFMTAAEQYRPLDIARTIHHLYNKSICLQDSSAIEEPLGREDTQRKITLDLMTRPAKTGKPLNVVILTGVQGIGRSTLAKALSTSAFPGVRPGGPIFDLSAAADAVDWHLRFFEEAKDGNLAPGEAAAQIQAFGKLSPADQALSLATSLDHWANINQVVTIKTRRGLRDRGKALSPWLDSLFQLLAQRPASRLILVSDRRLADTALIPHGNVEQYPLEELSDDDIQFLLTKRLEPRFIRPELLPGISSHIHGHPATAQHVVKLVNSGKSLDTLVLLPDPILEFQDTLMRGMFAAENEALTTLQRRILALLCHFPRLPASILTRTFPETDKSELVKALWELSDFSLVNQGDFGLYRVPAVVGSAYRRYTNSDDAEIFSRVSKILQSDFANDTLSVELIESLLVGSSNMKAGIPHELKEVLTPANILPFVEEEYYRGRRINGEVGRNHFNTAASTAKLALMMPGSDDTLEEILFYGSDALVRMGQLPEEFLKEMKKRGFSTADYIEGSYLFHNGRDYDKAATKVRASLTSKNFRLRKTRLLARIYLRAGKFTDALDILNALPEARILNDVGLAVMKLKALKGARLHPDAKELEAKIRDREDVFGDLAIYRASSALRENRLDDAERFLRQAEAAPQSNKLTTLLIGCAIEVEAGDTSRLSEACSLARGSNRESDAWQLQARAAVASSDWKFAKECLSRIDKKDYFDYSIELRALDQEIDDPMTIADPVAQHGAKTQREQVLRGIASSTDRFGS
tara:strand:+ start:259 stop:2862 length:2604 start_codon:yes stop_codon:yes gene_type:complete